MGHVRGSSGLVWSYPSRPRRSAARERDAGGGSYVRPDAPLPRSRYVPYPSAAAASHPIPPIGTRSGLLGGSSGALVVAEPIGRVEPPTEVRGDPPDLSSAQPGTAVPGAPDELDAPPRRGARWAGLCAGPVEGAARGGAEPGRDCARAWPSAPRLSRTVTKILRAMEWGSADSALMKTCIGRGRSS